MPEGASSNPFNVTTGPLPASRKVHVPGERHPELNVAMREIDLTPSSGEPPVRVYDTSGPFSDPQAKIDIRAGLPPLRAPWLTDPRHPPPPPPPPTPPHPGPLCP